MGNGTVLVTGGYTVGSGYAANSELYDPATNTWSAAASLTTARRYHTATLLGSGKVLVTGGNTSSAYLSSAELYDPATNTWIAAASMATQRRSHTATRLGTGNVLEVSVCLNVEDPRLVDDIGAAVCTPGAVDKWLLKKPLPDSIKPTEAPNAVALRAAVAALATSSIGGDHQEEVTFAASLATGDECTVPVHVHVPLKGPTKKGKAVLKMQAVAASVRDSDKLKLTCLPSDAAP